MIWKTTNGLGQEVVWYSEDEYLSLLFALDNAKELLKLHIKENGSDTHIDRALAEINEGLEWTNV